MSFNIGFTKNVIVSNAMIKPNFSNEIIFADLTTQETIKKSGDTEYFTKNSKWLNAKFIGKAYNKAKNLLDQKQFPDGISINVLSAVIGTNYKDKKTYINVHIHDFELSK